MSGVVATCTVLCLLHSWRLTPRAHTERGRGGPLVQPTAAETRQGPLNHGAFGAHALAGFWLAAGCAAVCSDPSLAADGRASAAIIRYGQAK